jgi:PilZ domain
VLREILACEYKINTLQSRGPVAQRLEQRTHNPLVPGSNPGGPTNLNRSESVPLSSQKVSGYSSGKSAQSQSQQDTKSINTLGVRSGRQALGVSVSRIWDALKAAEQHRARMIQRTQEQQLEMHRGDRRNSKRVELNVPLFVYGSNSDRQPFHEEAFTLDLNDGGCKLSLEEEVYPGQRLCLTNTENQAERECRVVHVSKRIQGRLRIGVTFFQPDAQFWEAE